MEQLNNQRKCVLEISQYRLLPLITNNILLTAESTTIHLNVVRVHPDPRIVLDHDVPVMSEDNSSTPSQWDLTTQQVCMSWHHPTINHGKFVVSSCLSSNAVCFCSRFHCPHDHRLCPRIPAPSLFHYSDGLHAAKGICSLHSDHQLLARFIISMNCNHCQYNRLVLHLPDRHTFPTPSDNRSCRTSMAIVMSPGSQQKPTSKSL